MSSELLVRHPAPFPTESLFGYILRLSQENGYTTPWTLFLTAGMKPHEIRRAGVRVTKLARIANRSASELDAIAYFSPARRRSCRLLGHPLVPADLNLKKPKFCPQCVAEKGFIEGHWDLRLMTGCPIHRQSLLSTCPKCSGPVRWLRRGLLECQCGADLDGDQPPISVAEASLLGIVRNRALHLAPSTENPSGLPRAGLQSMDLRTLLFVILTLGKWQLIADSADWQDSKSLIRAAAHVLENWPANFFGLLRDIGAKASTRITNGSVRQQFDNVYWVLFKYKIIGKSEQADFLRITFLDFALNHWGRGFVDHRLIRRLGEKLPAKRFQTPSEIAKDLGVDPRTAARLLEDKKIYRKRIRCGKVERSLVDRNLIDIRRNYPGRVYRARKAAAMIGLSPAVLRSLKTSGHYEVRHLFPTAPGFHALDIETFGQKMLRLQSPHTADVPPRQNCLALREATKGFHGYLGGGAEVVRAVLSRDLSVGRSIDGTVGGLLIPREEFYWFVEKARCRIFGKSKSCGRAARDLCLGCESIPGLVASGLLASIRTPVGVRITEESIAQFKRQYVSMGSIAKALDTSSRALESFCQKNDISVVIIHLKCNHGRRLFVRKKDARVLLRIESR